MPFSGGTAGAHDDAMHQGNAKRDVAEGVAGLSAAGGLLGSDRQILCPVDTGNDIYLIDRTSGFAMWRVHLVSSNETELYIRDGGVWVEVAHQNMKNVANGIAALDAAGSLLVPGSKIYYTRDGSDDVHIYERTSDEEAYAFHRVGADDYTLFVKESNVWKQVQTEGMKDVADGIAGLDGNGRIGESRVGGLFLKYLIGDASLHTHTGHVSTDTGSFVLMKTITINTLNRTPSTTRIKFDLYRTGFFGEVKGRIYKNGAPFGTERATNSDSAITYSEDLSFEQGDTIELWLYGYGAGTPANNDEFYICGTTPQLTLQEAIDDSDVGNIDPFVATNSTP